MISLRPTRRGLAASLVLVAVLATGCSSGSSEGSSAPDATPSSTSTSTTTTTTIPATEQTEPPGPLQGGSKGKRTLAVQQALKDQHYDPGELDGKFGAKVRMAVWAYQGLHGLPQDGIVGPELEALILARSPQPMFKPELGPTHTEVDLTRQVMMVFRDGAPVLITHVSTGSQIPYCEDTDQGRNCGNAVTPEGTYKFGRRVAGWREAPLGKLYNPVYFNGGIAVHGANSVPGHPASHGCVRIPMSIAEYFPSLVNTGDVITVYRS